MEPFLGLKMINLRWPLFPETRKKDPSKVPVMALLPDKFNTFDQNLLFLIDIA